MKKERDVKELTVDDNLSEQPVNNSSNKEQKKQEEELKTENSDKTESTNSSENKDNKTEETDKNKEKESKKEESEHSFYQDKDEKEKGLIGRWFSKRWFRITFILTIVFLILLGLGLGLGLGLSGNDDENSVKFGDSNVTEKIEEIYDNAYSLKIKDSFDVLSQQAIIWASEQLYENGMITESEWANLQDEKDYAQDVVDQEKNDYQDEYGDNWEEEWDAHLNDLGYDNEDEYVNGLYSDAVLQEINKIFTEGTTFGGDIIVFSSDPANDTGISDKYVSTSVNDVGNYAGVNTRDTVNGAAVPDYELFIDGFLYHYRPVATTTISLSFTFSSINYDGLYGSDVVFTDSSQLESIWNFLTDLYLSYFSYDQLFIATGDYSYSTEKDSLDILNPVYSGQTTVQSAKSLSGTEQINFATMLVYNPNLIDEYGSLIYKEDSTQQETQRMAYGINDSIGIAVSQNGGSQWPGYTSDGNGGISTKPATQDETILSIYEVSSANLNDNDYWSYVNDLATIGEYFYSYYLADYPLTQNSNRNVVGVTFVDYDYDVLTIDDTTGEYVFMSSDELGLQKGIVFITFDQTGLHFIFPAIHYDLSLTNGIYDPLFVGQAMFISDLDNQWSYENVNPNTAYFDISSSYKNWFNENSEYIYLNAALNDQQFVLDNFSDQESYQEFVDEFYNYIFLTNYDQYLTFIYSEYDFIDKYSDLYSDIDNPAGPTPSTWETLFIAFYDTIMSFDINWFDYDFDIQSTDQLLTTGKLYNEVEVNSNREERR